MTGSIPASWIGLEEESTLRHFLRQELDVVGNSLTGPLPSWLVSMEYGFRNNANDAVESFNKVCLNLNVFSFLVMFLEMR